jgi:hypothetical protein
LDQLALLAVTQVFKPLPGEPKFESVFVCGRAKEVKTVETQKLNLFQLLTRSRVKSLVEVNGLTR